MPYDPYRPIREELARAGSTLERGLVRSAAGKAREQELGLAHEARMTGLGLQGERLGLEKKRQAAAERVSTLQEKRIKQQIDTHDIQVDLDEIFALAGEDNAMNMGRILLKKGGTVNEDGTISKNVPLGAMPSIMSIMLPILQRGDIKHFIQETDGSNWGVTASGKKVSIGIKSPLKETRTSKTFSEEMNLAVLKGHMKSITAIDNMIALGQKKNEMGEFVALTDVNKDQLNAKRTQIMKEVNLLRGIIEKEKPKEIPKSDKTLSPEEQLIKDIIERRRKAKSADDTATSIRKPIEQPGLLK